MYCFYLISSSVYSVYVSYMQVTRLSYHASVNVCAGNTAMQQARLAASVSHRISITAT